MITERELRRDEIPLIWSIDRSEVVENIYHLEDGLLVLGPGSHRCHRMAQAFLLPGILMSEARALSTAYRLCSGEGQRLVCRSR
jgi:hypothetical protein